MNETEKAAPAGAAGGGGALTYPFDRKPAAGRTEEVADGVLWLRMPLPFRLDHINLYLLRDGDGWVIVDTGIRGQETFTLWEDLFGRVLRGDPVHRIVVTHMHPDHAGQAGWLTRHFGTELWMTRAEFLTCKMLAGDGPNDVPHDAIEFYRRAGFDEHGLDLYKQRFGRFGAMIEPLPAGYRRLRDGDRLAIDGHEWEIVIGRGHSPEHACLFCAERGILISGDQVLPRISSNVSVFPTEPTANPLEEWLESCRSLRERLPADALVLPSHNEPFRGLHTRLGQLVAGHLAGLRELYRMCATPQRVIDCFPALFRSEVTDGVLLLATGESLAHLHYLLERGALAREYDAHGAARFTQAGPLEAALES